MKTAIVWHSVYPWDVRIEKFCRSITAAGGEAVVISKERPGPPAFVNPFWIAGAARRIRREGVQLVIVRDLPLALPFALLGPFLKVPVMLDMAENYPAALLAYRNKMYAPFLFGNAWLPRAYEKLALRYLSHVIVVTEEQKNRLLALGLPGKKVTIVGNTPEYSGLERLGSEDVDGALAGKKYILYSGFMDPHRGLKTLVLAFNELKEAYADHFLVLIGNGKDVGALKALVEKCGLSGRVIFKGWMDSRSIPAYIRNSALCVIPHLKSEHTDTTMPNKIFDYLYFGKPVVVSDAEPLRRMMDEFRCGAVFKSGDHRDLSEALKRFLGKPYPAEDSLRSRKLVETKYNWARDGAALVELVERYG